MLFIRGCKRNDGRHSPQFLKRNGELAQRHGALEAEIVSLTPTFPGIADVLGETFGVKGDESGYYVVKLTATADGQSWEIESGPHTEQEAERLAREKLVIPPEPEPNIEDLILQEWERRAA